MCDAMATLRDARGVADRLEHTAGARESARTTVGPDTRTGIRHPETVPGIGTGQGVRVSEPDQGRESGNPEGDSGETAPHRPSTVLPTDHTPGDTVSQPTATPTPTSTTPYGQLVNRGCRYEYGKWVAGAAKAKAEGRDFSRVLRALLDGYLRGDFKV